MKKRVVVKNKKRTLKNERKKNKNNLFRLIIAGIFILVILSSILGIVFTGKIVYSSTSETMTLTKGASKNINGVLVTLSDFSKKSSGEFVANVVVSNMPASNRLTLSSADPKQTINLLGNSYTFNLISAEDNYATINTTDHSKKQNWQGQINEHAFVKFNYISITLFDTDRTDSYFTTTFFVDLLSGDSLRFDKTSLKQNVNVLGTNYDVEVISTADNSATIKITNPLGKFCMSSGEKCGGASNCCSGSSCINNKCSADSKCKTANKNCASSAECCLNLRCTLGRCISPLVAICKKSGQNCNYFKPNECCSKKCISRFGSWGYLMGGYCQ